MLVIRQEQLAALGAPHRERFVEKTRQSLAELFPGDPRLEDVPATRAMIEEAMKRAAIYGVEAPREVSLYVFLVHDLGPGFEAAPERAWMRTLLRDDSLTPRTKMDVIYKRLELAQRKTG